MTGAGKGVTIGLIAGFAIPACIGGVIGGVGGLQICGKAPDFIVAVVMGAVLYGLLIGIPASLILGLAGALIGLFTERPDIQEGEPPRSRFTLSVMMGILLILGLLFAASQIFMANL